MTVSTENFFVYFLFITENLSGISRNLSQIFFLRFPDVDEYMNTSKNIAKRNFLTILVIFFEKYALQQNRTFQKNTCKLWDNFTVEEF